MCGHRRSRYSEHVQRDRDIRHEQRDRDMRAADADRERVADLLREQAGEGRLEPDELEERLEAAYSAKTLADLDALTADLPRSQPRSRQHRGGAFPFSPAVLLVGALVLVSVLVGHPAFWLFFLLFFMHGRLWWSAPRWR